MITAADIARISVSLCLGFTSLWSLGAWWCFVWTTVSILGVYFMRRKKLPALYHGHAEPGWEKVKDAYIQLIESGQELGSAFAVYHQGALVVDMWGGYSDVEAERPWSRDTLAVMWSSTKGMCALAVAHLYDKGLLEYGEPVARYWPEFAQNGKNDVTIEQLVSHQAGLIVTSEPFRVALVTENPEELGQLLARQPPQWQPGTAQGYHALTYGLYIDQLIRKVDPSGRGLKEYFQQEVCDTIGAEHHIGLPRELSHRCVRTQIMDCIQSDFGYKYIFFTLIPFCCFTFPLFELPMYIRGYLNGNDFILRSNNATDWKDFDAYKMNNLDFQVHPIGSTHGFSSARDVARIYSALVSGESMLGYRVFKQETVDYVGSLVCEGPDKLIVQKSYYGPGMMIFPGTFNADAWAYPGFGHLGFGGQYAICDPARQLAWAYCTNQMNLMAHAVLDPRYAALRDAMLECYEKLEKNNKTGLGVN